ncbi:MAG: DEAD/DEAH box helicase, partial [Opitutaceae bacterium]
EFDLSAANQVGATFGGFRLSWNDWNGTWGRSAGRNFAEEFSAWVAALPKDVTVRTSPELAGFVEEPVRATLDFTATPVEGGRDWFDLTVAYRVEDATLTPAEIALLLKARGKWVRLPKKGWKRLEVAAPEAEGATSATLDRLGLTAEDVMESGNEATHRVHALQLAAESAALEGRDARLAAELRGRLSEITARPAPPPPKGLSATLRPYQIEGYHFLAHLSDQGFGGVLADDMGLGKTVQTLAWLLRLADGAAAGAFRALVVCPKSVTHGWLAETARFAPGLRAAAFDPASAAPDGKAPECELLVTNYTQLRLHAGWFKAKAWDVVVLDEGQFIKNPTSQVAAAARALASRHRLVLTGTPVENRLSDLWSLFAFAQPGLLGSQASFRRQFNERDPSALGRLHRRVRHFLLRRTKAQAAPDLPPRTEHELVVDLEPAQRKLYDAELKRARAQLLGIETDRALDRVRFNILASLLRLRQICCHPALVDPAHADLPSAKLDALIERLEELREEGHQVLVFSQFVGMLELIRARLEQAGIGHLMLTGATEDRQRLVEQFQTDSSRTVFLLSLKAAGFGLNLTAASYAVLYDPWWNPAVEAQAIDRTHRIGQTKPVFAYRLLAAGTIEQKIRALQQEKAALAAAVVQEESLASVLDLDSLRRILA